MNEFDPETVDNQREIFSLHRQYCLDTRYPRLAAKQEESNPVSIGIDPWGEVDIRGRCPTCSDYYFIERRDIHFHNGCLVQCPTCENLSYVPGQYFYGSFFQDAVITAAVIMPIEMFGKWFYAHPHIQKLISMKKDEASRKRAIQQCFASCPQCLREYAFDKLRTIGKFRQPQCPHCKNLFVRALLVEKCAPERPVDFRYFVLGATYGAAFGDEPINIIIRKDDWEPNF